MHVEYKTRSSTLDLMILLAGNSASSDRHRLVGNSFNCARTGDRIISYVIIVFDVNSAALRIDRGPSPTPPAFVFEALLLSRCVEGPLVIDFLLIQHA